MCRCLRTFVSFGFAQLHVLHRLDKAERIERGHLLLLFFPVCCWSQVIIVVHPLFVCMMVQTISTCTLFFANVVVVAALGDDSHVLMTSIRAIRDAL